MNITNMPGFFAEGSLHQNFFVHPQTRTKFIPVKQVSEIVLSALDMGVEQGWFFGFCDDRAGFCHTSVKVPGGGHIDTTCEYKGGCKSEYRP